MAKKKCRSCRTEFDQFNTLQNLCFKCLAKKAKTTREKSERKEHRRAKERLKTKSDWLGEAQTAYNRWVRAADPHGVCISCQKPPKKRNAGHYRSVGACAELRYCLYNVHLQCEYCNTHLSSNAIEYRINLVKKIGQENVAWLEGPHKIKKYTIEDAKEIKKGFNQWAKELENADYLLD